RQLVGCDGWQGSSGGGVFDAKGKLVGIIQGGVGVLEMAFRGSTQAGILWYSGFAPLKKDS
ncbi:hypothetical protein ACXYUI_32635, partial [Klebsiella pneumoniae]